MIFPLLYFITVHNTPYLFHLYTTSLHTFIKLVIFFQQNIVLKIIYMTKQRLSGQLVYISYMDIQLSIYVFYGLKYPPIFLKQMIVVMLWKFVYM
jgi:hypothetical protein